MKKGLVITTFIAAVIISAATVVLYNTFNTQGDLHFADQEHPRAFFPISNGLIEMFDSTLFMIDTGSNFSTINHKTLDRLKRMGMDIEYSHIPIIGRGKDNSIHISNGHYTVTLPVTEYKLRYDSASKSIHWLPTGRMANYIKGVNVVLTDDDQVNTLGMDVLEDFVLEYQYFRKALALRTIVEENYQELADLEYPISWDNLFGSAHRYYLPISVDNGKKYDYLIDTGISRLCLKMPIDDSLYSKRPLSMDNYHNGKVIEEVRLADKAWIKIGRRAGSHDVYYAPYNVESRSFNPILFFTQDAAFDFRKKKVYLRPYALLRFPTEEEDSTQNSINSYYQYIQTSTK